MELDYWKLKEELGLDHYEVRHWLGWHHHVCLVSIADAFSLPSKRASKNLWFELAEREEKIANPPH